MSEIHEHNFTFFGKHDIVNLQVVMDHQIDKPEVVAAL
jgi:hypothetical protein